VRYGGNTCCVELRCGPHIVILDGGSGMRELGLALQAEAKAVRADILMSHTHQDHICGLPFFGPMYSRHADLRIWAGHLTATSGIETVLRASWSAPVMPDLADAMRAKLAFFDITPGAAWDLAPGLAVSTVRLTHPGGATGYRIAWAGRSLCYITDTEHPPTGNDAAIQAFVQGTDVLIYDSCYTEEEYATRIGWGHSTWRHGVALADAAGAGQLVLFHHDPAHDDAMMDHIGAQAAAARAGTIVAQDGLALTIG
jgi:phosphoribosyl 1,2-cyclic phosphodiesterase